MFRPVPYHYRPEDRGRSLDRMLEENRIIELMIHLMEMGMVIGIAAVVAFTIRRQKHVFSTDHRAEAGIASDRRAH